MSITRTPYLSENSIYAAMLEARKPKFPCPKCGEKCKAPCEGGKCECTCGHKFKPKADKLTEGVTSSNSIHGEIEEYMEEFVSGIQQAVDAETAEAKLSELEKIDLTGGDKKIIGAIRKFIGAMAKAQADFETFQKSLKYDYVVTKKAGSAGSEAELENADFESEAVKDDEVATPVEKE